jgi:UDP-N-acetylglucosamine transferase subunit ALG13
MRQAAIALTDNCRIRLSTGRMATLQQRSRGLVRKIEMSKIEHFSSADCRIIINHEGQKAILRQVRMSAARPVAQQPNQSIGILNRRQQQLSANS